jgi:DNA polymerase III delta subunit
MLYVYYGTDTIGVRQRAFARLHQTEEAGATVTRIEAEQYTPGLLSDVVGAVSLFGGTHAYLLDTPSNNSEFQAAVVAQLPALAESVYTFVVIEGGLLAPEKKQYAPHAAELEEVKGAAAERYNIFALADALSRKDKKTLWLLLQEARLAGLSAEEIIGTLWWQLKTLRLAAVTGSAAEAGMKDFPYQKAKRALSNFKPGELAMLSEHLLMLYHDGHGGRRDIDMALEEWVLRV